MFTVMNVLTHATVGSTSVCLVNEGGETRRLAFDRSYGDGLPGSFTLMIMKKNLVRNHVATEN